MTALSGRQPNPLILADHVLSWAGVLGALWFSGAFIYVALSSLTYPFHLEWMEGQSIDVVQRIVNGLPVYTAPSIDYVPYIYTPLYFYASAFVSLFTGVDFFPARLVSFLSALGCGALIAAWIRKENGSWKAAVIGAGLFFATYRLSGRWFDNARVDSLALCLTLAGLYSFSYYRGRRSALVAALLLAAAFFTKQAALVMMAPVLAAGLYTDRRHALMTGAMVLLLIVSGIFAADIVSGGWFSFYVFKVPAGHGMARFYLTRFWTEDMFSKVGLLLLTAIAAVGYAIRENGKTALRYVALAAGGLGAAYAARVHSYGYMNVLMPAHAVLALLAGVACAHLERRGHFTILAGITVLLLMQMKSLWYDPRPLIPTQQSLEAGNRFLEHIGRVEGDIFMPELQFVQTRAGKKSYALGMAAFDLLRADLKERNDVKVNFRKELAETISSQRFASIIPGRLVPLPELKKYYRFQEHLEYPKEYVTGAINFLRTDLFVRIPDANPH